MSETYLGDGLYASFDGWMITLRAPREHGDHWVGIDAVVFANLLRFAQSEADWGKIVKLIGRENNRESAT